MGWHRVRHDWSDLAANATKTAGTADALYWTDTWLMVKSSSTAKAFSLNIIKLTLLLDCFKHLHAVEKEQKEFCVTAAWGLYLPKRLKLFTLKKHTKQNRIKWSEVKLLSRVWLFVTPWIVAHQAPPSMGFTRQEYWSGLPFPSPGDLANPGIEPRSPTLQADALTSEPK